MTIDGYFHTPPVMLPESYRREKEALNTKWEVVIKTGLKALKRIKQEKEKLARGRK